MRKVIVVAVREYQAAVRTKAFILSLVMMPIMMGGSILVQVLMRDKVDTSDKRVAIVDGPGVLYGAVAEAARERNEKTIFKEREEGDVQPGDRKQVKPRFLLEQVALDTDNYADIGFRLSERVRKGELLGYVLIEPNVLTSEKDPQQASISYHSNSPTYDDFQEWVSAPLNKRIQDLRLQAANLDPDTVERLTRWVPVGNLGLVSRDESGGITQAQKTNKVANIFVPFGLMLLMFMVVMVGAAPLMQSVIEEKMARIAEVLLGSVPPFQLMTGKLLGMVGVSMTIVTIYLLGAFYAIHRAGFGSLFPNHLVFWFVIYQALAVLMFGSVFAAIGAAVTDAKEAQSLMTPVMLVVVAPMFIWLNVVREPSSTFSLVTSLIPPATPMLMIMRQAVPPGIPLWQPVVGVVGVFLMTVLCIFAAGRVFRVGILMQGRGARLGELARWIVRG